VKKKIGSGFFVVLMLFCLPAVAQLLPAVDSTPNATLARDPNTYGTTAETAHLIFNQDFNVNLPATTWGSAPSSWQRYVSNFNGCCLEAPLLLPDGALITAIELEGCDTSTTGQLAGVVAACITPATTICGAVSPIVTSGVAATPGCAFFRANFTATVVVDNVAKTYFVQVKNLGDVTGAVTLRAVRVYYKLQISPDPATATFADVPVGHPFHRFVEALVAAGITGGCGGGNYCPDAPVTRGQMAVFLAAALGLHWAP
jgi:hypothetical protein